MSWRRRVGLYPGAEPIWVCGSPARAKRRSILRGLPQAAGDVIAAAAGDRAAQARAVRRGRGADRSGEVPLRAAVATVGTRRRSSPLDPASRAAGGPRRHDGRAAQVLQRWRTSSSSAERWWTWARQHGSDMIEPAALAKPVIVGPYTGNFAEAMNKLRGGGGGDGSGGRGDAGADGSACCGIRRRRRREWVRGAGGGEKEKGATLRHAEVIVGLLNRRGRAMPA